MLNHERISKTSISEELERHLNRQKESEISKSKKKLKDGELEGTLDEIESYYNFLTHKLAYVPEVQTVRPELKRKFIEVILYIDGLSIKDSNKLSMILTYAVIVNKVNTHLEHLTDSETALLCAAMMTIPISQHDMYGTVLSNEHILRSIEAKTDERDSQLNICDNIIKYCNMTAYDDMSDEDYRKAVTDCFRIIEQYQLSEKEKNRK